MYFVTRAGRFGHSNNSLYNTVDLFNVPYNRMGLYENVKSMNELKENDFYKGFFIDFYNALDARSSLIRPLSQEEITESAFTQKRVARALNVIPKKVSEVSSFELSQETIYCRNTENQKLNCNYQLVKDGKEYETSVSITGFAQYLVQKHEGETVYAKHILRDDLEGEISYQITKDSEENYTKRVVQYIVPEDVTERPYFVVLSETSEDQNELAKEVYAISDILATFNSKYQVNPVNFDPRKR